MTEVKMFERFFWDDDGTLKDQTIEWSNPHSDSAIWDGKSRLYMSSFLPFNTKYFDITVANDQGGTLDIDIWYNDEWVSVVDSIDYTDLLTKSGNIVFTVDENKGWMIEDKSSDIEGLTTTNIYDSYWMRLTLATTSDSALSINYIGHKFAEDSDLLLKYPMLKSQSLKTAFATGKTDWHDQLVLASDFIIDDLKSRALIISKDQLLNVTRFKNACCYKAADIIFHGLGEKWFDHATKAEARYAQDMHMDNFGIDINGDGEPSRFEQTVRIRRMNR
jgi:hypothetical protein